VTRDGPANENRTTRPAMVFEIVVAEPHESEWLTERQNAALRTALEWLVTHPEGTSHDP
jgi:hypothetical protein